MLRTCEGLMPGSRVYMKADEGTKGGDKSKADKSKESKEATERYNVAVKCGADRATLERLVKPILKVVEKHGDK